jgi:hypothetical protein
MLAVLLALAIAGRSAASLLPWRAAPVPETTRKESLLFSWIKSRTAPTSFLKQQGSPSSLWLYHGSLMDPLTGRFLAHVEGLEVVRLVAHWENRTETVQDDTKGSFLKRIRSSPIADLTQSLLQGAAPLQAVATLQSRKVFLYRNAKGDLLRSVRLRPGSPKKKVPLDQAITTWEATTTIAQPVAAKEEKDGSSSFFFATVLPSLTTQASTVVWNRADVHWEPPAESKKTSSRRGLGRRKATEADTAGMGQLDFTIHARPRGKRASSSDALQRQLVASSPDQASSSSLSPPRAALLSVGPSSGSDAAAPGAHETYRYSLPGRLVYSRYGEAPVWYGPGRTCRLELRGRQVVEEELSDPVLQELARRLATVPRLQVDQLFPEEYQAQQESASHGRMGPLLNRLPTSQIQTCWQRMLQASTIKTLPEKSL